MKRLLLTSLTALTLMAALVGGPASAQSSLAVGQAVYMPTGTYMYQGGTCANMRSTNTSIAVTLECKVLKLIPCGADTYVVVKCVYGSNETLYVNKAADLIPG